MPERLPVSQCNTCSGRLFSCGLLGSLEPSLLKMALDNSAKTFLEVMWWVKWKIHPWLSELNQTQGVRMQLQGFPLRWQYPPPISAERGSGKVCISWPWIKPAQDLSSWCEAFPKKVLLPRSGALCAQRGLQALCCSNVMWLRLCTVGQKE